MLIVQMVDDFMSGWGEARDKTNVLAIECPDRETAECIYASAVCRDEMRNVHISNKINNVGDKVTLQVEPASKYEAWRESGRLLRPLLKGMRYDKRKKIGHVFAGLAQRDMIPDLPVREIRDTVYKLCEISEKLRGYYTRECNGYYEQSMEKTIDKLRDHAEEIAKKLGGTVYHQRDPRGCAMRLIMPGDVPEGQDVSCHYTNGIALSMHRDD